MKIRTIVVGSIVAVVVFLIAGIPTALIPTPFFKRMFEPLLTDYVFLVAFSGLVGAFSTLHLRSHSNSKRSGFMALGGSITTLFSFACPVCNVFLVSLLGVGALLVLIEPIRPLLGIVGIAMLSTAIFIKAKKCHCNCKR